MTRLGTFLAGLALTSALNPHVVLAQQPAQVIGPITPGDLAVFNSPTIIKDALVPANGVLTPLTTNTNFYVNKDQGSDSNNCLSTGAGACQTSARVAALIANSYFIQAGVTATIQYQCASYPCTYANLPFNAFQYSGPGSIAIVGNATADNIVMNLTSIANCVFCFNYVTGNWSLSGFKIVSAVGSGNGAGIFVNGAESNVTYSNIDFGALLGGVQAEIVQGGQIANTGSIAISGSAAEHMLCADAAVCHETAGTITISNSPTFTCVYEVHGAGAVIGLGNNFSGSASGTSACGDGTSEIDAILADLPGSQTVSVSGNAVIAGVKALSATPTTFANTAIGGAGSIFYITDGKASNCGDSACTTWGTTVTGGGGALPLLIWSNGANFTLIGK